MEAGDGSVGAPLLRQFIEFSLGRQGWPAVEVQHSPLKADVVGEENVRPTEREDQECLGGPAADALNTVILVYLTNNNSKPIRSNKYKVTKLRHTNIIAQSPVQIVSGMV